MSVKGVIPKTKEEQLAAFTKLSELEPGPSVELGALAELDTVSNAQVAPAAAIALNKLANVAAGTDGLAAGTIQATMQALATRIQALEDAAP